MNDSAYDPERTSLETKVGQVWNTEELQDDYTVRGFASPFVVVKRKSDGVIGSLEFQHAPRFYYSFVPVQETEETEEKHVKSSAQSVDT